MYQIVGQEMVIVVKFLRCDYSETLIKYSIFFLLIHDVIDVVLSTQF